MLQNDTDGQHNVFFTWVNSGARGDHDNVAMGWRRNELSDDEGSLELNGWIVGVLEETKKRKRELKKRVGKQAMEEASTTQRV